MAKKPLYYVQVDYQGYSFEIVEIATPWAQLEIYDFNFYEEFGVETINENGSTVYEVDFSYVRDIIEGWHYNEIIIVGFWVNKFELNFSPKNATDYYIDSQHRYYDLAGSFHCVVHEEGCDTYSVTEKVDDFKIEDFSTGSSLDGNYLSIKDTTKVWVAGIDDEFFRVKRSFLATIDGANNYSVFYELLDKRQKSTVVHQFYVSDVEPVVKADDEDEG